MLTGDQELFYRENGYLMVPGALDAAELTELRRVTDALVARGSRLTESDPVFDIAPGKEACEGRLRRIKDPQRQDPVYDATMRHPKIIGIVQRLIGKGVRLESAKLNIKPVGGGGPIDWRQDWSASPYTNDDVLTVGIYLEDCSEEQGPLMVIPKSHRGPVFNHHHKGIYVMAVNPKDFESDYAAPVTLAGKAGSITIHHVRTLHASAGNRMGKPRRLLLYSYTAIDACPLTLQPDWEEFNARIIVGEPTFRPRMEKLPVELPVPMACDTTIYIEQEKV